MTLAYFLVIVILVVILVVVVSRLLRDRVVWTVLFGRKGFLFQFYNQVDSIIPLLFFHFVFLPMTLPFVCALVCLFVVEFGGILMYSK